MNKGKVTREPLGAPEKSESCRRAVAHVVMRLVFRSASRCAPHDSRLLMPGRDEDFLPPLAAPLFFGASRKNCPSSVIASTLFACVCSIATSDSYCRRAYTSAA